MGRIVKDTKLDSRETRMKLPVATEPYWRLIHEGLHLGYRKGPLGGMWLVRIRNGKNYSKTRLGKADDFQDSNGQDILSFKEAQAAAIKQTEPQFKIKKVTVGEAAEHYMNWFKQHRKTHKSTQIYLDAHILPTFGKTLITDLKPRDIRAWHENLAATPARKRTAKGTKQSFSDKPLTHDGKRARKASANRIMTILKAVLNKAYEDELAFDDSAWRRVKPFANADEPNIRFLTQDESQRLINSCPADFRKLVKAALYTGARYSELANLKIGEVNPDDGRIFISISKNGKGRHIPLNSEGLEFFKGEIAGKARERNVFARDDGSSWKTDYQHRPMKKACEQAKIIPAIGFHDLRHTYASLLAQAGIDLLTISKLLGHADTRITSRHYAHLCDKTLSNAVRKLPDFGHKSDQAISILPVRKRK